MSIKKIKVVIAKSPSQWDGEISEYLSKTSKIKIHTCYSFVLGSKPERVDFEYWEPLVPNLPDDDQKNLYKNADLAVIVLTEKVTQNTAQNLSSAIDDRYSELEKMIAIVTSMANQGDYSLDMLKLIHKNVEDFYFEQEL